MKFTQNELIIAKEIDLCQVAGSLGYTVKRVGKCLTLKEMDSIRIYNRTHWFRWSRQYDKGENGGYQRIDSELKSRDLKSQVVINDLIEIKNHLVITQGINEEKKEFALPLPSVDNSYLHSYLNQVRCIGKSLIDYFIRKDLIYESRDYHNVVFKGKDQDEITRFASMRGVFDRNGKSFKCDVAGNDKTYVFNVVNDGSGELIVFEAAIELMSYIDFCRDFETNKIALGMLADAPIETFITEHRQIHVIKLCLNKDEPGRWATVEIMK